MILYTKKGGSFSKKQFKYMQCKAGETLGLKWDLKGWDLNVTKFQAELKNRVAYKKINISYKQVSKEYLYFDLLDVTEIVR